MNELIDLQVRTAPTLTHAGHVRVPLFGQYLRVLAFGRRKDMLNVLAEPPALTPRFAREGTEALLCPTYSLQPTAYSLSA
jgi:hypothetical protein